MTHLRLDVRISALPCIYKDRLSIAPGAFAWVTGGKQWTPLLSIDRMEGMPIGRAGLYEPRPGDNLPAGAFADLLFDLDRLPPGAFPLSLPEDPEQARQRMRFRYRIEPMVIDLPRKLITKARMLSLWVGPTDPSQLQIDALLLEREQEQDGY